MGSLMVTDMNPSEARIDYAREPARVPSGPIDVFCAIDVMSDDGTIFPALMLPSIEHPRRERRELVHALDRIVVALTTSSRTGRASLAQQTGVAAVTLP